MTALDQRVIATVNRRKVIRQVAHMLAPFLVGSVVLAIQLRFIVALPPPDDAIDAMLHAFGRHSLQLLACMIILGTALSVPAIVRLLLLRGIVIDAQTMAFQARRRRQSYILLDNVSEVVIRRTGRALLLGAGRGVGLVLLRPECYGHSGKRRTRGPRMSFRIFGCHELCLPLYNESPEEIARVIAEAASNVRGQDVPIRYEPRLPTARPIAQNLSLSVVPAGLECLECGYNLRMLPLSAMCPECGVPVARSLQGDLLGYADPGWVRALRIGSALIVWAAVAMLFGCAAFNRGMLALRGGAAARAELRVLQICMAITLLLGTCGFLFFTRRSPAPISLIRDPASRRWARLGMAFAALLVGVAAARLRLLPLPASMSALAGVVLLAWAMLLWYSRRIAERLPARVCPAVATMGAVLFHITAASMFLFALTEMLRTRGAAPGSSPAPSTLALYLFTAGITVHPLIVAAVFAIICWRVRARARTLPSGRPPPEVPQLRLARP